MIPLKPEILAAMLELTAQENGASIFRKACLLAIAAAVKVPLDADDKTIVKGVIAYCERHDRLHRAADAWYPPSGMSKSAVLVTVPVDTVARELAERGFEKYREVDTGSNWRHTDSDHVPLPATQDDRSYAICVRDACVAVAKVTGESPITVLARWLPVEAK